jgi:iron(III) transport system substrate-binding protein
MTLKFIFITKSLPDLRFSMRHALLAAMILLFSACSSENVQVTMPAEKDASAEDGTLVIYSGRSAESVEGLFALFEKESGVQVEVRYDKTPSIAERLHTEGPLTQADVFFAQDSGYLGALAAADLLQPLPEGMASRVDPRFIGSEGRWIATSGRMRVLVYSPDRVSPAELPQTLDALANPKWTGRLGWAPSNASFQSHLSALRDTWGEDKTRSWLESMISLNPAEYPKNSPQVKAVSTGEIDIGWVNHYYLHKLQVSDPELKAANYSFSVAGDAGNLMMLSGVAMTTATRRSQTGEIFMRFLLSDQAQRYFTETGFEYPTVTGISPHPDLPPVRDSLLKVDQAALADVGATVALLKELGLQ